MPERAADPHRIVSLLSISSILSRDALILIFLADSLKNFLICSNFKGGRVTPMNSCDCIISGVFEFSLNAQVENQNLVISVIVTQHRTTTLKKG